MPGRETTKIETLQAAATAAVNGAISESGGWLGSIIAEIVESNGGTSTANINFEGSLDPTFATAYAVGYQRVDATPTLARATATVAVTASLKQVFQILDPYPYLRARLSSPANGAIVTVRLFSSSGV